jgi:hypothetical protein
MPARRAAAFAASRVLGSTPLTLQGKLFAMFVLASRVFVLRRGRGSLTPLPPRGPAIREENVDEITKPVRAHEISSPW